MTTHDNERLDKELNELLEDVPEVDLEKKIIRLVNNRIRTIVLNVLLVVAVICTVLFLGISPIMNASHYDPSDEENHLEEVLYEYVELTMPWREVSRNAMQVESKGFGNYEVSITLLDKTKPLLIGGNNVRFALEQGKLSVESDPELLMVHHANRFAMSENSLTKAEVMELPSSAMLYLSLSLDEAVPLETLRNLDVTVEWIQVYQPTVEFQGGMLMNSSMGRSDRTTINMDDEQLLKFYCDHMELLLEHGEIWPQLSLLDGDGEIFYPTASTEVLNKTYDNALTLEEIMVENFCVCGKRDQIAALYDQFSFDSIYVDNVRLIGQI